MESNRKRRGFMKGKLVVPFYRSAKPSSNLQYSSSNVKPSQSSPSPASVSYVVRQEYIIQAPPKQKVSFIVPDNKSKNNTNNDANFNNGNNNNINNREKLAQFEKHFGVVADESVDIKAANYISLVRERFKLERMNSERVKREEMAMQQK